MEEVETQLKLEGHRRRRPLASRPVGSLSGIVAAEDEDGDVADDSATEDARSAAATSRRRTGAEDDT